MAEKLKVCFKWTKRKCKETSPVNLQSSATLYRKELEKTNPQKSKEIKERERNRWHTRKVLASKLPEQDLEAMRKKWKMQKAAQRKRKIEHVEENSNPQPQQSTTKIKAMSLEEKREYWRNYKRQSRNKASIQKKCFLQKKDRERKRKPCSEITLNPPQSTSKSRASVYRKINALKNQMPDTPRTYATVLKKLGSKNSSGDQSGEIQSGILKVPSDSLESALKNSLPEGKASAGGLNRASVYHSAIVAAKSGPTYRQVQKIFLSLPAKALMSQLSISIQAT